MYPWPNIVPTLKVLRGASAGGKEGSVRSSYPLFAKSWKNTGDEGAEPAGTTRPLVGAVSEIRFRSIDHKAALLAIKDLHKGEHP